MRMFLAIRRLFAHSYRRPVPSTFWNGSQRALKRPSTPTRLKSSVCSRTIWVHDLMTANLGRHERFPCRKINVGEFDESVA